MPGTPNNVIAGPGWLYAAPLGTTEPANATAALGTAWVSLGYTEEGSMFSYNVTREDMEVAEEVFPVKSYTTKIDTMVSFSMAEPTAANLSMAMNNGVTSTNPTSVEPPNPGAEVYIMLLLEATSGARWLFRKCIQSGNLEVAHKKAPDKTLIPVEFKLYLPATGKLFTVFTPTSGVV